MQPMKMVLQGSTTESDESITTIFVRLDDSKSDEFDQPFRVVKRRRSHRKTPSPKATSSKEENPTPKKKKKIILEV